MSRSCVFHSHKSFTGLLDLRWCGCLTAACLVWQNSANNFPQDNPSNKPFKRLNSSANEVSPFIFRKARWLVLARQRLDFNGVKQH
ncbi:hypothetical protein BJX99DRAFT_58380 [Aspergillus californicus]